MPLPPRTPIPGVYGIVNPSTGRCYIGSSIDVWKRWQEHRKHLREGRHHSPALQNAWNRHGEPSFAFVFLEAARREDLRAAEQCWLDQLRPEYNAAPSALAPMQGRSHSAESRRKMSESRRGRARSTCQTVPLTIGGVTYPSISAAAASLGVMPKTARRMAAEGRTDRLPRGHRQPQSVPVRIRGVDYPSQSAAARALGVCVGTVAAWRCRGEGARHPPAGDAMPG